ncbi:hypothetical protein BS50DRAFT_336314 [Corynespora cassiicola Philippines]|uniref:Uncharacterized protein n=1 Tax=Corynespora cassiicola Philippines TaxID=1448308 RepID=A0A2T2NVB0_CORCC|nr:hypothetical protein BS50DRAFT_336314 [Corynespora cassiicola Philippines]
MSRKVGGIASGIDVRGCQMQWRCLSYDVDPETGRRKEEKEQRAHGDSGRFRVGSEGRHPRRRWMEKCTVRVLSRPRATHVEHKQGPRSRLSAGSTEVPGRTCLGPDARIGSRARVVRNTMASQSSDGRRGRAGGDGDCQLYKHVASPSLPWLLQVLPFGCRTGEGASPAHQRVQTSEPKPMASKTLPSPSDGLQRC